MATAIAEWHAGECDALRPNRPEQLQQGTQDFGGRQLRASGLPIIVKVARPRRSAKYGRVNSTNLADPTQQGRAPFEPGELVARGVLERLGQGLRRDS